MAMREPDEQAQPHDLAAAEALVAAERECAADERRADWHAETLEWIARTTDPAHLDGIRDEANKHSDYWDDECEQALAARRGALNPSAPAQRAAAISQRFSPGEFMAGAKAPRFAGNTDWAQRYAAVIRTVVHAHAEEAPRSQQIHLGPSEIGSPCDRRVVAKLAGLPRTNHVVDPWPSVVGTAVHAWLDEAFTADNRRTGQTRWLAEQRVTPLDGHAGTADLYDFTEAVVVDHKALGEESMGKIRRPEGPPEHYQVQLLLYALGYRRLGLPVRRVALIAYPRTGGSLDGLYVWEHELTPADDERLVEVVRRLQWRKQWAAAITAGSAQINQVPANPLDDCHFCGLFRPQSARDGGPGCPGHTAAPGQL